MGRLRFSRGVVQQAVALFLIAVALNYPWEIAQAPLYVGMGSWGNSWWHCFVASVGDGVLVWLIFAIGWVAFRRADWYRHPSGLTYGLMLATGLCIGLGVEWAAIHVLNRWAYTTAMPLMPGLDVGLVPVLQMLLLPPLIFHIAARWAKHKGNYVRQNTS